jgi:hypothetical protein
VFPEGRLDFVEQRWSGYTRFGADKRFRFRLAAP